jgi:hypothetical protein
VTPEGEAGNARDPVFQQPIFIISPPRSGSTLLFETLADAPDVFTTGRESHALIESITPLNPGYRGFDSNRLDAADATDDAIAELRRRFHSQMHDRDGKPPLRPYRMLEKTPKNALRIPLLARAFPEACFVYLHRDPRQTLSSMIEAWQSARFRTYPQLPDWTGLPWSLLLVPGWRELIGRPLQEVVAAQWKATTSILLDDLAAFPASRCHAIRYDEFLAAPGEMMTRLCNAVGLTWDRPIDAGLPLSRYTVSKPSPDKWRANAEVIEQVLPDLQATLERAERFASDRSIA